MLTVYLGHCQKKVTIPVTSYVYKCRNNNEQACFTHLFSRKFLCNLGNAFNFSNTLQNVVS